MKRTAGQKVPEDVYNDVFSFLTKQPRSWKTAGELPSDIFEEHSSWFRSLPVLKIGHIYESYKAVPGSLFEDDNVPTYFILKTGKHGTFLVDTAGYSYARYLVRIKDSDARML